MKSRSSWPAKAKLDEVSRISSILIYLFVIKVFVKETNIRLLILIKYKEKRSDHVGFLLALCPGWCLGIQQASQLSVDLRI